VPDDASLPPPPAEAADRRTTPALALTALGIVYGDLGTSPLYTMQTIIGAAGGKVDANAALGLLSLVIWALLITVSLKYCAFVMRADNAGEGGILALMALVTGNRPDRYAWLVAMGLFGAALIYGDGVITPAISVLSALEGTSVVTGALKPYVMPLAVVVLLGLFGGQMFGIARIGRLFGPVMLLWFAVIGVLGAIKVVQHPGVLVAINPLYAIMFLVHHGWASFIVLGGVFLAITGGEALYADMGSVGRGSIRVVWYGVVLPALVLSYAGQTALVQAGQVGDRNPFFLMAPDWAVIPLVVLATLATIIASQAIITGAFSLTRQAMQLGWLPGLRIYQTSDAEYGQIYVPMVNWVMMAATLALTVGFGSSARLAGAYGTAVSTTMLLTTALLYHAMTSQWHWRPWVAWSVAGGFLLIDCGFFAANLLKIADGGWIPLAIAAVLFLVMTTWRHGIDAVRERLTSEQVKPELFLRNLTDGAIPRVPGTAVFLSRNTRSVPAVMVRHVADMGALHRRLVSLSIRFSDTPRVQDDARLQIELVAEGFWHLTAHYGFVEVPDIEALLVQAKEGGCDLNLEDAVFFVSHDDVVASEKSQKLPIWRRLLFAVMFRNAVRTVDRFHLPSKHFVEVGRQIEI